MRTSRWPCYESPVANQVGRKQGVTAACRGGRNRRRADGQRRCPARCPRPGWQGAACAHYRRGSADRSRSIAAGRRRVGGRRRRGRGGARHSPSRAHGRPRQAARGSTGRTRRAQTVDPGSRPSKSARRAYNAIRFSAPNRLGILRVVMVVFALHIALQLMLLVLSSRDAYSYNVLTILSWLHVIAEGIAFWLVVNRFKVARPFVIAMAVVSILVDALVMARTQGFRLLLFVTDDLFYFFLIFYFAFSDRVKYTLVNDLSTYRPADLGQGVMARRWSWEFIRNLGIYFVVFSVLGHWMEMAMCQLIIAGLVEGSTTPPTPCCGVTGCIPSPWRACRWSSSPSRCTRCTSACSSACPIRSRRTPSAWRQRADLHHHRVWHGAHRQRQP